VLGLPVCHANSVRMAVSGPASDCSSGVRTGSPDGGFNRSTQRYG
jgi:hypothetical protein